MRSTRFNIPMILVLTTWPAFALAGEGSWPFETGGTIQSPPSIADINNDGKLEIVFGSSDGQVYCLDATGTLLWQVTLGGPITSAPALANIDDDPNTLEVVVGTTSPSGPRRLYCLGSDGSVLTFYQALYPVGVAPVVTDLENDGTLEIIFDENTANIDPDILRCVNVISDGSGISLVDRWSVPMPPDYNWYSNVGAPAVADFDGDGVEEVLVAGRGEWPVMLINNEGEIQWSFRPHVSTTTMPPVIADMDGDNQLDILIASSYRVFSLRAAGGYRNWQGVLEAPASTLPAVADLLGDDGVRDIFVRDTAAPVLTFRISDPAGEAEANGASYAPTISTDGRFVVFQSDATNLVTTVVDTNGHSDVFVYEMSSGTITRMSVDSSSPPQQATGGGSFAPAISANGRFIAFESDAKNLVGICDPGVSGDCGEFRDVFFRDRGSSCPTDFNGDGVVDAVDLTILVGAWGSVEPCTPYVVADLDQDCRVGLLDQWILLGSMGPCP